MQQQQQKQDRCDGIAAVVSAEEREAEQERKNIEDEVRESNGKEKECERELAKIDCL